MKKCLCPSCGKELVLLDTDRVYDLWENYFTTIEVNEFWCDDCDIEITLRFKEEKGE